MSAFARATSVWIAKTLALAVMLGALVYLLNQPRQIVRAGKVACDPTNPAVGCIPVIQGVPWAVLVVLVLLPMFWLAAYAVSSRDGGFTLANFVQLATDPTLSKPYLIALGMALAVGEVSDAVVYGDLMFSFGVPVAGLPPRE